MWTPSAGRRQPLELIGFDTCLMATVDVAAIFSDTSRNIWWPPRKPSPPTAGCYSQLGGRAWHRTRAMDGARLGRDHLRQRTMAGCEAVGTQDNTTLSLTDLSKADDRCWRPTRPSAQEALAAACGPTPPSSRSLRARRRPERKLRRQHPGAGLHQHGGPRPSWPG